MADTPQNKFLETVIEKAKDIGSLFLIANSIMLDCPIIYCSAQLSAKMKFSRTTVLQKNAYLDFLFGKQTDLLSIECYREAINLNKKQNVELLLYDKSGFKAWYLVSTVPVVNYCLEKVLILVFFNEIEHLQKSLNGHDSPKTKWQKIGKRVIIKNELKSFIKRKVNDNKRSLEEMINFYNQLFIPFYGREKVQLPFYIISQNHILKRYWDLFILFIMVYTAIVLPFSICFKMYPKVINILDHIFDSAFIVDIGLNFITTYVDKNGVLVTDLKKIMMNYLKGWFSMHIIFALLSFISSLFHSDRDSVYAIRILLLVRLLRLTIAPKKLLPYLDNNIFTLFAWMLFYFMCAHWLACIWYLIGFQIDVIVKPNNNGWLSDLMLIENPNINGSITTLIANGKGPVIVDCYITALYFAVTILSTCGFGNWGNAADTLTEKYFTIFAMIFSCVLYAFIFAKVNNIIAQLYHATNEYSAQLNAIQHFVKTYKVPNSIGSRLEDYFIATWTVTKGVNREKIMNGFPRDLQSDLCLRIHKKILEKEPCFKNMSKKALRSVSRYFWVLRTPPGDILITNSELLNSVYFVVSGAFEVSCEEELIGLIGPGDSFGKRLVERPEKSVCEVKSTSYSIVHSINIDSLFEALALFPEELNKIKYTLKLSVDITKKIRKDESKFRELLLSSWGKMTESMKDVNCSSFKATNLNQIDCSNFNTKTRNILTEKNQEIDVQLCKKVSMEISDDKFSAIEKQLKNARKVFKKRSNKVDCELGNQLRELNSLDKKTFPNDNTLV
ncbi:potassium voltage-gated channel subfamily H member 7 isoform X3 [Hydra vulgaris]|uniref:Potassium voltage-gated channel subfamily H member 7 isoform X3 n=2 Tax=Hydra vulgaris TaxID=6087 RepID=A0ABM4CJ34_HYDVU